MESMIALASVLFILSMINERIANFIKLQFSDSKLLGLSIGNLKDKKNDSEEDDRDKRIILLNIIIGTIVCLLLRADLISIIANIDKPSAGIGWKTFCVNNVVNWITLMPGSFLTGCFLSLGSKFWHDLLDLLLYTKNIKGQLADPQSFNQVQNNEITKQKDMQSIEKAAAAFKQEVIAIANVTTAILNTEATIPVMEVYTGENFDTNIQIPKKLFYVDSKNAAKSIDIKIIQNFDPIVHSVLFPATNILNEDPYPQNRGSLGGKVYNKNTNEAYFLSCYHVVKSISQRWDFNPRGFETVFEYESNKPCGQIINALRDEEVDAAIMRANDSYEISDSINGIGTIYSTRDLNIDDKWFQTKVKIFGGITQSLKVGYVSDINVHADITYFKDNSTEMEIHRLNNLIFIKSIDTDQFSQPGDSGSFVIDEYNYIIGMLVGGQGTLSFVIPINTVLKRLNIKIKQS